MRVAQRAMERFMREIFLKGKYRNKEMPKWDRSGHVSQKKDGRWTQSILEWRPRQECDKK